jgi:Tfp pilus assembly protein PilV
LSASTLVRKPREAGFTLAEALAALLVLALAMGQVSELVGQFVRATRETREAARATSRLLTAYREADAMAGDGPGGITIGDNVFSFNGASDTLGKPCIFDAIGRRCR